MVDEELTEGLNDLFLVKMQEFASHHLDSARNLVETLVVFLAKYSAAATYLGDPETLLPLEKGVDGDSENEDSPARDIFLRVSAFITALRAKARSSRVHDVAPKLSIAAKLSPTLRTNNDTDNKEPQELPSPAVPQSTPIISVDDLSISPPNASWEFPQITPPVTELLPPQESKTPPMKEPAEHEIEMHPINPAVVNPGPHITPAPSQATREQMTEHTKEDEVAPLPPPPQRHLNIAERLSGQKTARYGISEREREMEERWRVLWAAAVQGAMSKLHDGDHKDGPV
eukprot:Gregarina_sp_Poly_1__3857@NODE_2150_length_2597_cov_158_277075_g1385_i0_p2_GENE_NODE_2150_length_2597_cov_158_277075_g1385_i0NODE_2150_length_2597_cov_158_277075_g1385_i0_p2_ORF_typecomplete_len320_score51_33_NODE_2150_length_2597_cov_158_277075_g1385_i0103960